MLLNIILVVVACIVLVAIGFLLLLAKAHKKVAQGQAIVRTGVGGAKVALDSGIFVIPIMHHHEVIDISTKMINLQLLSEDMLAIVEGEKIDLNVTFYIRINKDPKTVVEVAQTFGCASTFQQEFVEKLFVPRLTEAMQVVSQQAIKENFIYNHNQFKNTLLEEVGTDLNGYILDDCAVHLKRRR